MKNCLILNICFKGMKMSNRIVWTFERNVRFTNRLLLGYFMDKWSSKELVYVTINSSFFVRD